MWIYDFTYLDKFHGATTITVGRQMSEMVSGLFRKFYAQDWSMTRIKKELGLHQEQVKRMIRKVLNAYLGAQQQ